MGEAVIEARVTGVAAPRPARVDAEATEVHVPFICVIIAAQAVCATLSNRVENVVVFGTIE